MKNKMIEKKKMEQRKIEARGIPTLKTLTSSRGQALVEFSLVLPIFLLLLVGMFDVGSMLYTKHILDKAVREGARAGVIEVNDAAAQNVAGAMCGMVLADFGVNNACTIQVVSVGSVDALRVNISHHFDPMFIDGIFHSFDGLQLQATATMRREG